MADLTADSIGDILKGKQLAGPVLQILEIQQIKRADSSQPNSFRLLISDGVSKTRNAALHSKHNHLITEGKLKQFSLIRVDSYILSKGVIFISQLTVIASESTEITGEVPFEKDETVSESTIFEILDKIETINRIGFLGCGMMAQAMIPAAIASHLVESFNIITSDPSSSSLARMSALGVKTTQNNREVVEFANIIIIAVKPDVIPALLEEIKPSITTNHLIVSIAAGVTIATMEKVLGNMTRIIRVMPNTPCLISECASAFSTNNCAKEQDVEFVHAFMSSVGITYRLPESKLDVVTGLSGSGPAYCFLMIESLADGAVLMGLQRDIAIKLAAQTLLGAAKMVLETGKHPAELKDQVCSPGGTTIAGVHALEHSAFRASLMDAVRAATTRCAELAKK